MTPYMFVINSVPLPENRNYQIVGGAHVHIWVMDINSDTAKIRAIEYIKSQLWHPVEVEYAFDVSQEQIAALGKAEARLYRLAQVNGIGCDFVAWPKEEGHSDDPVILDRP